MVFKDFDELIEKAKSAGIKKKIAVVSAEDEHSLEAVLRAENDGIVQPVLVGDKEKIIEILNKLEANPDNYDIYDEKEFTEAAKIGVELINKGKADFLMKGKLETAQLLKAVVNKEYGLSKGGVMSHMAIQKIPAYHKLLVTTDGGMLVYPTLEQKQKIIENAVGVLNNMGYDNPKVAVLAAAEKVNPKIEESVHGAQLKKMNQEGIIKNCIIEGPISFDLAMVKERAITKNYESPVAGDADILVVPNIVAGNVLGKSLVEMAKATMAGIIVGAKVPIVLTSRGSSSEEKYLSIVLAASAVK